MIPGRTTIKMTSSQIPQLWSSLRDRVPTSFLPCRARDSREPEPQEEPPSSLPHPGQGSGSCPCLRSGLGSEHEALLPVLVSLLVVLSRRSRLARHQCLLAARRTMDCINDGVEYARGTYNEAVDITSTVYNAATSKTAQRTLLTTLLFTFLSAILFGFACVGYLAFYHEYLPDQIMTVPVHLQYGWVA